MSAVLRALGAAFSTAILSLVHLAAWLLAPWRMGRLLRTVSLPRFHEHRLRTALTVLGIALGVAVLIAVVLVNRSVMRGFTETLEDVSGRVDLEVTAARGFEEDRLDVVRGVAGVAPRRPARDRQNVATCGAGARARRASRPRALRAVVGVVPAAP